MVFKNLISLKVFSLSFLFILISFSGFGQGTQCSNATSLTVNGACLSGTISDTTENIPDITNCSANFYKEGWYTFTVTGGPLNVTITASISEDRNLYLQLMSSTGACSNRAEIACANTTDSNVAQTETITANSLANGTYYIKVVDARNGGNHNMALDSICVTAVAPCNDPPSVDATTSVTATAATINWTAATPAPTGGYDYVVSTDNNPGAAGNVATGNTNTTSANITGLTAGTMYYVFVKSACNSNWIGPDIFTTSSVPPPSNNDPCNAEPLTVNSSCVYTQYTNENATDSGVADPGCADYQGSDVWFSAVVPANGILNISTDSGVMTDSGIAAYSGTCGSLNFIQCNDDGGPGFMSAINLTGRTPGETIWVRVWEYGNDNNGTFDICVESPTPPTITGINTTSGCPGDSLTITGTDLATTYSVSIGGTAATITATNATSVTVTVGSGTTGTVSVTTPGGTTTSAATYTVHPLPADPGNPTSNSPQCNPPGVTITQSGSAPAGVTWYWQTTANGTDTTNNANTPLVATTSGNYYIRARNNTTGCWSSGSGFINVLVYTSISSLASSPSPADSVSNVCYAGVGAINSISWTAAAGATGYDVYFGTNATPPLVSTDQAGNSYNTGALAANTTYYWRIVPRNPCGPTTGTPITWSFTTIGTPCTCVPSPSSVDGQGITNVTFSTVNNTTGAEANNYGDYSALVGQALEGSTLPVDVTFSTGIFAYQTTIWVDWNDNLVFTDPGEEMFVDAVGTNGTLNASFVIPGGTAGTHIMRIGSQDSGQVTDPCYTGTYGSFEDYSLQIIPLNCTDDPINVTASSITQTTATISWTHPTPQPGNGYEYIISTDNTTATPVGDITGTTTGNSINLTTLTAGTTYYVFVRGNCNGTDFGIWVTTTFTTPCTTTVNTATVCGIIVDESGNDPFGADPFVTDPTAQLDCDNGDVTLEVYANLRETTSYLVEKITYPSPAPDYDFPTLGNGDNQVIGTDDVWADSRTDLDFTFCFYGNTYTQTLVGSNGLITFDSSINPGDFCNWDIDFDVPDTNDLYEQTIYGVMHDIDPNGLPAGAIKSRTTGTAPCRQFQVSWHDIPMYSDSSRLYTGMIVLHETTNIIEVFIEEKRIENGNVSPWNDGNAVVGIQGDITPLTPNNEYAVAPCRNVLDDNWEVTNEAWRFTPNGAVIAPNSVTWYSASNGGTGGTSVGSGSTLNVSQADTYTAVSEYNLCSGLVTLEDDIIVTDSRKVWNGSVDDEWNRAANWTPNGIPTAIDCIVVPDVTTTNNNSPTLSSASPPIPPTPGLGRSLRVESNGLVEVQQYSDLVITDEVYIENTLTPNGKLILRTGSNLIQVTNTGITNTGNIQMQRTVNSLTSQDYVYWSSPVDGFDVNNVSPGSSLIYKWIPTIGGNGTGNYGDWQATGEVMQDGLGYIIRGVSGTSPEGVAATNTVEFMGTPKNGAITVPISRGSYNGGPYAGAGGTQATALDDNWNLIGNPYPSAILASEFISQNAALDGSTPDPNTPAIVGTVYLWRHQSAPSAIGDPFYGDFVYNYNPNDYIAHNGTGSNPAGFSGNIGSGQAFFVLMDHNAATPSNVVFNNDMRLNGGTPNDNNDFYRSSSNRTEIERHRVWLDLITPNNTANSILVGYVENATNDLDRLFDGYELSETTTRFYSILNDTDLAIQGRALPFDVTDMVPLGIEIPTAGNYSIAINSLDGLFENEEQNIYLEDTYTNFIHDLRLSPYSFTAEPGEFNDRFILRYTNNALGVDEFSSGAAITITAPGNNYIKVKANNSPIQSIIVYDVLGRQLYNNTAVNQLEFRIDNVSQSDGVLFVKAELENGIQKVQKVILKH